MITISDWKNFYIPFLIPNSFQLEKCSESSKDLQCILYREMETRKQNVNSKCQLLTNQDESFKFQNNLTLLNRSDNFLVLKYR